jgi:hypothetical protein
MGLGCFLSLDVESNIHLLASSLLKSEDKGTYEWIFSKFSSFFGAAPIVIITDGDTTMADALKKVWPSTVHLLCTWHLYKNFHEHIHVYTLSLCVIIKDGILLLTIGGGFVKEVT